MKETRDRNFTVRLTESEYRQLKERADKANKSIAEYIRNLVFGGKTE